jgi:hypothetical protein
MIATIEDNRTGFFQKYRKFYLIISAHSLVCWFYAHYYNKEPFKNPKVTGYYKALSHLMPSVEKTYQCYDQLSRPFLNRQNINTLQ